MKTSELSPPTALGVRIRRGVNLARFTTMKVGGDAELFATVQSVEALIKLVRWARANALPYFILGGGSNLLISDAGLRGLVIHNRCRAVRLDRPPCCQLVEDERPYLFAESGAPMAGMARTSVREGLTGLEWAVSVPGTVGGAVVGNAGAHGGEVKDSLENTLLIDEEGEIGEMTVNELAYSYRGSALKRRMALRAGFQPVILSANFRLPYGDLGEIRARADRCLEQRRRTQPPEPSLGSTFVNPPGDYAGRLIEAAGLKGAAVGGAAVSQVHANFIVNAGGVGATRARDVLALIEQIERVVVDRFGVQLEREIALVGEWETVHDGYQ